MKLFFFFIHFSLTELEVARDDLLLELHKQPKQSPTDNNVSLLFNHVMGKPLTCLMGLQPGPTKNQAVQPKKMPRGLKFRI